ncbi:MAG: alpha/beta hydrolase [Cyanobacteria bacterium J06639_1]
MAIVSIFTVVLSAVGCFLSVWIVVPAPVFVLLPLSVAAPELAPWLCLGNGVALALAVVQGSQVLRWVAGGLALVGLGLSCLPLVQLPQVIRDVDAEFVQQLGVDIEAIAPPLQSRPFRTIDVFRGIPRVTVGHESEILFASPDGVPLTMEVYRPEDRTVYPAIVTIYGGAWQRGSASENARFNESLAARGFVVFAISYRHAPQFQFPAQLEDVRAAMRWIEQQAETYGADGDRVAVVGRSAGAQLAMLLGYGREFSGKIRAVVNFYGPVDLAAGYRSPPIPDPINTRPTLEIFLGGSPEQYPDRYRQASPATYLRESLPPTLLLYGQRDRVVEAKYGRALASKLRVLGNTAVAIEFPWADHAFDAVFRGASSQLSLYSVERFLSWALKS